MNVHHHTGAHTNPKENATGRTEDQKCYIPKKDSETGTLYGQNRECSLCPWSVNSQEPFLLNSYHIQKKVLGVQDP